MRTQKLRETVEDLSFGLLSTAINLALSLASFGVILSTSGRDPRSVAHAAEVAATLTGISKETLRRAFWKANNQGLLKRERRKGHGYWEATELGKKRLSSNFPTYHTERPWDKRLYLITYDIPEEAHADRTKLRENLLKIGARRFQDSVYLILWDPTEVLKQFLKEHAIAGQVIVADTGTDGSIGEKDLDDLVWEVFQLEMLNTRYKNLLEEVERKTLPSIKMFFHYLSILRDDPQLPFELLGPAWKGDRVYQAVEKIIKNMKS